MAVNAFEGARRIGMLIAAIWTIGWIVAAFFFSEPYISVNYTISWPNELPKRSDPSCTFGDNEIEYVTVQTAKGTEAHVRLCFLAQPSNDGRKLIFYAVDPSNPKLFIGNARHSTEVQDYAKRVKNGFVLPKADEPWIDQQLWPERLKILGQGALGAIGGLLFLWCFSWAIGWIVRGFLGIPRGKDRKAEG